MLTWQANSASTKNSMNLTIYCSKLTENFPKLLHIICLMLFRNFRKIRLKILAWIWRKLNIWWISQFVFSKLYETFHINTQNMIYCVRISQTISPNMMKFPRLVDIICFMLKLHIRSFFWGQIWPKFGWNWKFDESHNLFLQNWKMFPILLHIIWLMLCKTYRKFWATFFVSKFWSNFR